MHKQLLIIGATVGKYKEQENIKNNLKEQTTLGGTSVNYLLNGGFEEVISSTAFANWEISGDVTRSAALSGMEGDLCASFGISAGSVSSLTQYVYLNGSQIVGEETSGNITLYLYDVSGSPVGMQYHGASYAADVWDTCWFEKNLQGDIVAV